MIVKMTKYTFVVLASRREEFLGRLQELGLVDVTTTGWEPSDDDRALISQIERRKEAAEILRGMGGWIAVEGGEIRATPYQTGSEAFESFEAARNETAALDAEIARLEKLADEARPWGEFDPEMLREIAANGVSIRFFVAPAATVPAADNVLIVNEIKGVAYFAVLAVAGAAGVAETAAGDTAGAAASDGQPEIVGNAQEIRLPSESISALEGRLEVIMAERKSWDKVFARAAATLPKIEKETAEMADNLQFKQAVTAAGEQAADGSLVVMEAWAREKQQNEVDYALERDQDAIVIKSRPTPDDETPVELQNARIVRPFEFIAEMYALPRYGTMDLTRWFAPFYMIFFAFCLSDLGYGLAIFAGGLYLALKAKGGMKTIGKLSMWCGGAAVVFGFLVGSFFGIDIKTWSIFEGVKDQIFFPHGEGNDMFLFILALGFGVFQIVFGLILKAITTARAFGIRYALSTIGFVIVLVAGVVYGVQGMVGGGPETGAAAGSAAGSGSGLVFGIPAATLTTVLYAAMGVGGFLMLFMNNPASWNPLKNLGGGLWNTYNDVIGFASDALSYIRLFAIGLSGGVLAVVFNDIAVGVSGDIPVVKQLIMLVILLIGHGLNLFMSALSSMVHPLRLTFVEFYKNAGFEGAVRTFNPLQKSVKQ